MNFSAKLKLVAALVLLGLVLQSVWCFAEGAGLVHCPHGECATEDAGDGSDHRDSGTPSPVQEGWTGTGCAHAGCHIPLTSPVATVSLVHWIAPCHRLGGSPAPVPPESPVEEIEHPPQLS